MSTSYNKNETTTLPPLTSQAALAIKQKMKQMARELAQNEEIGLDERTIMRYLGEKAERLIAANFLDESLGGNDHSRQQHSMKIVP
jgi:predicted transcriptional regulator